METEVQSMDCTVDKMTYDENTSPSGNQNQNDQEKNVPMESINKNGKSCVDRVEADSKNV